jgi:glyoxylase-like metal-dependent hydrolase (beta-lactamase superfamily II)
MVKPVKNTLSSLIIAIFLSSGLAAFADVLKVQKVTDEIWSFVGPLEQRDAENLGNNATFGLIATSDGAVLIDPGGSARGAAMIDNVIKGLTDEPVRYVINTGGQDHRWLGNAYWQAKGAKVIAASTAVDDQKARYSIQMTILSQFIGDGLVGTTDSYADITFEEEYTLEIGGKTLEIRHPASAHTPGDSFVWIEASDTVFAGDIVYVGRVLGVMEFSNSVEWLEAFEAIEALEPKHLIPGHGPATTLEVARADTYDYLTNLRSRIAEHIEADGGIIDSVKVDQSMFSYLDQFEALAGRNAQAVFEQMEWE